MILKLENLNKTFQLEKGVFKKTGHTLKALTNVSLEIDQAETLALIGESGCGKSTLAKVLIGIENPDSGKLFYNNQPLTSFNKRPLNLMQEIQIVFQNPYSSLNPRQTILNIVGEPLLIHTKYNLAKRKQIVAETLSKVDLNPDMMGYYPHMLSGGQRQRVSIARAIVLNPKLILLDEPVSALDISVQAQVLNLLQDLKEDLKLTYLFISHDISVVKYFADRVIVMYLGRIVESGKTQDVINNPQHPYTKALIQSSLTIDSYKNKKPAALVGDLPSPLNPPKGCPFVTRCPVKIDQCSQAFPDVSYKENGRAVNCFLVDN